MRKLLSWCKRNLITLFGLRPVFHRNILGVSLTVDYNLRSLVPERDYQIILQLAGGKQCIFDVGANHGILSLLIAGADRKSEIHAFEASEAAVGIINRHVRLNGFMKEIRVVNGLIADRSGYVIPFYGEGSSGGASIVEGRLGHRAATFKATISLDDYARQFRLRPDFIKMDIEGAEGIAISGMRDILMESRPIVFLELHEFGSLKLHENAANILSFIKPLDYAMVYLRTGEVLSNANPLKGRGRCHVLLLPTIQCNSEFINSLNLHGL